MVVLAIAIITKGGKVLVSRQFVDMTRVRIESLLAAFPKLVNNGRQHTYVEAENVRYVYQPIENQYLLIITNKQSNILEDLDALRLLSKVVPEYVPAPITEETIASVAFDLIFAFDEIISIGHKENINVVQVRQNTEMESHEEKLHKMVRDSKIQDTKDIMKKKAMEIDKAKVERMRLEERVAAAGMGEYGMPSGVGQGYDQMQAPIQSMAPQYGTPMGGLNLGGRTGGGASIQQTSGGGGGKGMRLGKGNKAGKDFLDQLKAEGETVDITEQKKVGGMATGAVILEPCYISVQESLNVRLNREGGLENLEVSGILQLQVQKDDFAYLTVNVDTGRKPAECNFKLHPKIDKTNFNSNSVISLKDTSKPFPVGDALGVVKWRFVTQDEAALPLSVSCWPNDSATECSVNIEYELNVDYPLYDVIVVIPGLQQTPNVSEVDGDWHYDSQQGAMVWSIGTITPGDNSQGTLEYSTPPQDTDNFYPVHVSFRGDVSMCNISVVGATNLKSGEPLEYGSKSVLKTESYQAY